MRKVLRVSRQIINGLSSISGGLAALSLVAAAIIVTEGVVTRKLFRLSAIWQIEASVFLLIFACFVGAAFAQKHEHHLNVDLVLIYLSPKTRETLLIIVSIITCLLAAILSFYAWPMWWEVVVRNDHSESLWSPPLWIPYLFLPLGMTLLFLQYIVHIFDKIATLRKGELEEETTRFELKDIEIPRTDSSSKDS